MTENRPRPEKIMQYLQGTAPAFAMLAGMELDLFSVLKDGPKTADEVASDLNTNVEQTSILLRSLVAAELLQLENEKYSNTPEAQVFLVNDSPANMASGHNFFRYIWNAMLQTAETLRTGSPQMFHDYHDEDMAIEMEPVATSFHENSMMSSHALVSNVDFSKHQHIADIGGGTGAFALTLVRHVPDVQVTIIDLPEMIKYTEGYVREHDRIRVYEHDIVAQPIDISFDAAVMKAFTQVLSAEQNRKALKHTFDALDAGGTLYISANVLDDDGVSPKSTALFNLLFLNIYDGGQAFTESAYRTWLNDAGFIDIERHVTSSGSTLMIAKKPS